MSDHDEIKKTAFRYVAERRIPEDLRNAFAHIERAPLASLIDGFLADRPRYEQAALLAGIADLNQGRLQDLDVAEFRSYVVSKTGTTERELTRAAQVLRTFDDLVNDAKGTNRARPLAARDEDGRGGGALTPSEVLDLLRDDE